MSDKVWGVCRRIKGDCGKCGPEVNTKYGPGMPACYAHADEICQFVEAQRAEVGATDAKDAALWRDLPLLHQMDLMVIFGGAPTNDILLDKLTTFIEFKRKSVNSRQGEK